MEENQRKISNKKIIKYLKHQKMAEEIDRMAEKIKYLGRFEEVIHDGYHGINLHLWFQRNDFEIKINQETDFKYNIVIDGNYEMSSELWDLINNLIKQLERNCKEW